MRKLKLVYKAKRCKDTYTEIIDLEEYNNKGLQLVRDKIVRGKLDMGMYKFPMRLKTITINGRDVDKSTLLLLIDSKLSNKKIQIVMKERVKRL